MTEEYWDLHFGKRVFSKRIQRRIIIVHNRLERQRKNLQKQHRNKGERYVHPLQNTLLDYEKQKNN